MKNRILSLTRGSIPYIKELLPIAHTVVGCILMQQLDYWFHRKPDGFYKFLEPPHGVNYLYREGDSWTEELGVSSGEFRTAFDRIGIRYKSKNQFMHSGSKFQDKFYCSYSDRRDNLTYYFRNHEKLDNALTSLIFNKNEIDTVNVKEQFPVNHDSSFAGRAGFQSAQIENHDLPHVDNINFLSTDITSSESTLIPQQLGINNTDNGIYSEPELIFPSSLYDEERVALMKLLENVPYLTRQKMLDELHGAMRAGVIRNGNVPFLRSLVKAYRESRFESNLGVSVMAARNKSIRQRIATDQKELKQTAKGRAEGLIKIRAACLNK